MPPDTRPCTRCILRPRLDNPKKCTWLCQECYDLTLEVASRVRAGATGTPTVAESRGGTISPRSRGGRRLPPGGR